MKRTKKKKAKSSLYNVSDLKKWQQKKNKKRWRSPFIVSRERKMDVVLFVCKSIKSSCNTRKRTHTHTLASLIHRLPLKESVRVQKFTLFRGRPAPAPSNLSVISYTPPRTRSDSCFAFWTDQNGEKNKKQTYKDNRTFFSVDLLLASLSPVWLVIKSRPCSLALEGAENKQNLCGCVSLIRF